MQPLEPPDSHFLSAAEGWVGLGNVSEAKAELAQISGPKRKHPDVLEVRWGLAAREENWGEALKVARELLRLAPERASGWLHLAYSLRRLPDGTVQAAWDALLPASKLFPGEAIIPYNLACYACQMLDLATARKWLKRAAKVGGKEQIKLLALSDRDLELLWPEIRNM